METVNNNIIDPKKVLFLSVITWGLYDFFWFLNNWKIIKQKENSKIHPFGRSFLAIFYCYSFFKKVMDSASNSGYVEKYSAKKLATGYFLLTFVGVVLGKSIPGIGLWALVFSVIGLLASYSLFEVQKAINFNSEHESGVSNFNNSYSFGDAAFIIFGVLYTIFIIYGVSVPPSNPFESLQGLDIITP